MFLGKKQGEKVVWRQMEIKPIIQSCLCLLSKSTYHIHVYNYQTMIKNRVKGKDIQIWRCRRGCFQPHWNFAKSFIQLLYNLFLNSIILLISCYILGSVLKNFTWMIPLNLHNDMKNILLPYFLYSANKAT
jgi:hypothetical protein